MGLRMAIMRTRTKTVEKESLKLIKNYISEVAATLDRLPVETVAQVIDVLQEARVEGKRIYVIGNGGSAATASHLASDLSKGAIALGVPRLKAFAITDNIPLLTAWANDTAYENIFAEQLENLVEPGDVVIGLSGSGNSANILNGLRTAKARGATTIGFTGFNGGKLKNLVDIAIVVPNHNMEQIEDMHLLIEHVITTCLRGNGK